MSRVTSVTFFESVVNALLAAYTIVLSSLRLLLIFIVVSVLLVFDFYPIKVLGHIFLPLISSFLLLGLASRIDSTEMLEGNTIELLSLRQSRSRLVVRICVKWLSVSNASLYLRILDLSWEMRLTSLLYASYCYDLLALTMYVVAVFDEVRLLSE